MSEPKKGSRWQRFAAWVNGESEPRDPTTQYVMDRKAPLPSPSAELSEARDRLWLKKFIGLYPLAAAVLSLTLIAVLLATVLYIPPFGQPGNPTNNEVSQHYLEHSQEETGASNAVTGMILSYRGFDTLGESCVLFLAVSSVMILLQRDQNNTDSQSLRHLRREAVVERTHPDNILRKSARLLTPFILLFSFYVLLNGESSPGGGFSGGAILGGIAMGIYPDEATALEKYLEIAAVTRPNPENVAKYARLKPIFEKIYEGLYDVYPDIYDAKKWLTGEEV